MPRQRAASPAPTSPLLDEYFQQWLRGTVKPTLTPDDFPAPPAP